MHFPQSQLQLELKKKFMIRLDSTQNQFKLRLVKQRMKRKVLLLGERRLRHMPIFQIIDTSRLPAVIELQDGMIGSCHK